MAEKLNEGRYHRMREEIVIVDQFSSVGILTYGELNTRLPTVIIFNAGIIHKVGPNRAHVKLARKLSLNGYNVFRFDYGGQGDSIPYIDRDNHSCISRTLDVLEKKLNNSEFVVMGLCSGAEDAYQTGVADKRIKGIIMINGTGLDQKYDNLFGPEVMRRIQFRYYKKSFKKADRWLKILKGKSGVFSIRRIKSLMAAFIKRKPAIKSINIFNEIPNPFEVLENRNIALLLILTEGSTAFDFVNLIYEKYGKSHCEYVFMQNVDHIVTPVWAQYQLHDKVINWCNSCFK